MIPADSVRRQDLEDLYARWIVAIGDLCASAGSEEKARKAHEAFAAIIEYLHAGTIPEDDGPDRVLVRVIKEEL